MIAPHTVTSASKPTFIRAAPARVAPPPVAPPAPLSFDLARGALLWALFAAGLDAAAVGSEEQAPPALPSADGLHALARAATAASFDPWIMFAKRTAESSKAFDACCSAALAYVYSQGCHRAALFGDQAPAIANVDHGPPPVPGTPELHATLGALERAGQLADWIAFADRARKLFASISAPTGRGALVRAVGG